MIWIKVLNRKSNKDANGKKNGFTLVELLAVLIIISVLSLIITPLILNQIENAKKNLFIASAKNTLDAATQYVSKGNYIAKDGLSIKELEIKNKETVSGLVFFNTKEEYLLRNFSDGTYCASGVKNQLIVWKSSQCGDSTDLGAKLTLSIQEVTTKSITVSAQAEDEIGIIGYSYCIENCELSSNWHDSTQTEYKFDNLKSSKRYSIYVRVTNRIDHVTEKSIEGLTSALPTATYRVSPSGWAREKIVTINYPDNVENYLIVHSGTAKIDGVIVPLGEKRFVNENKVEITFETNGTIEAITSDGYNEVSPSTLTVSQIDIKPPENVGVREGMITSKSIQAIATGIDRDSGIKKYEFSINDGEWIDNGSGNTYTFDNLKTGNYTIKVRVTDNVDLQSEGSSVISTVSIVSPTYSVNPSGWVKSKTVTVNYENGYTNQFRVLSGTAVYKGVAVNNNSWITISGNSADVVFNSNGTIEARSTDEINTVTSSALTISQIDNTIPVINSAQIRSSVSGYNAVTTIIDSNVVDNSGATIQMYISNSGYEVNGIWENYSSSKAWNVGGTLDGGTRTVYITFKDLSGNKINRTLNYNVYKECSGNTSISYGGWGSCNKSCGGGTQTRSVTTTDNATGKICSTTAQNQSCNTQGCTLYRYRNKSVVTQTKQTRNPSIIKIYPTYSSNPFEICRCTALFGGSTSSVDWNFNLKLRSGYLYPGGDRIIGNIYPAKGCKPKSYKYCFTPDICSTYQYSLSCSEKKVNACDDDEEYQYVTVGSELKDKCVKTVYTCPAGTNLIGSTCYSEWSAWSYTYVAPSATVEVETKQA